MEYVYVLVLEPYHDISSLIGASSTLEKAKSHQLGKEWNDYGWYCKNRENVVSEVTNDDNTLLIFKLRVQ